MHCSIENCTKPILVREWCSTHYKYLSAHRLLPPKPIRQLKQCIIEDCENWLKYPRKGMCVRHYDAFSYHGDATKVQKVNHGYSRTGEFGIWGGMIDRCTNPREKSYKHYGGRGITICERWLDKRDGFQNFILDMDWRPSLKHSIDRIDVNGNYEPSNCRWATIHQQAANRRSNSGILGITKSKGNNKWLAYLMVDGVQVLYKYFYTKDEAIAVRKAAEIEYELVI